MKIVVAVHETRYSEAAINALMSMNLPANTEIKLLTVIPSEVPAASIGASSTNNQAELKEIVKDTLIAFKDMLRSREREMSWTVSYEVMQGDAQAQIIDTAKNWTANMIIMGSRGTKGAELLLSGSVAQSVINQAPCPVIVVKSNQTSSNESFKQGFKSILIAADNSDYFQAAIDWLKSLNWPVETKLNLVTVVQPLAESVNGTFSTAMISKLKQKQDTTISKAKTKLQTLAKMLTTCVCPENIGVQVVVGDPREAILQAADTCAADLIVMSSHGRTGLNQLFVGSVSQAVAVHSGCSVAIIRGIVPQGTTGELDKTGHFVIGDQEGLMILKKFTQLCKKG